MKNELEFLGRYYKRVQNKQQGGSGSCEGCGFSGYGLACPTIAPGPHKLSEEYSCYDESVSKTAACKETPRYYKWIESDPLYEDLKKAKEDE
jgi:hypothetical protein